MYFRSATAPGGNMSRVINQTHDIICERMEVEDEIQAKIHANEMELNIIMLAPVLIVALMRSANETFAPESGFSGRRCSCDRCIGTVCHRLHLGTENHCGEVKRNADCKNDLSGDRHGLGSSFYPADDARQKEDWRLRVCRKKNSAIKNCGQLGLPCSRCRCFRWIRQWAKR